MKNRMNNILKYKTLSRLPQESGFYSGVCPGAAAITIFSILFSSPWGTLGVEGAESRAHGAESRARSAECPSERKFIRAGWKTRPGLGSLFVCNSNLLAPLSPFVKGDESRFIGAGGIKNKTPGTRRKENNEHRITNAESGKNIPVRCTCVFHWYSSATNITGALHLEFQTSFAAIGETAAAPRKICSPASHPSGKKVQRTETLKENIE
jgi:hypothetical protein